MRARKASGFCKGDNMPARISMTKKQRDVLLALPETENEIVRHYTLDAKDLTAIAVAAHRKPA
jgi:hypothetical protein